ncbi:MAG: MATE family efflux transporter [Lachnoclostridium sp.]|nr:MATE family efflux transporter [Lachnospira sp.]MCM1249167.1 MATE family efflux transporter [Lachnoclostridium sp.]MCM1534899.1 MATE family efflux transporter [Clostridium sp.]
MKDKIQNTPKTECAGDFSANDSFIKEAVKKYMFPSVAALVGTTAVTTANSMIAGNDIGADALAALNMDNPIYLAFATLGSLINVGAASNASVCIGKNKINRANSYVSLALVLTLVFSALLTAAGLLCFPMLIKALGATERMKPYVWEYGKILLCGGTAFSFMYYPFHFLKTDGRPRQGTYMFLVMLAADLALCAIFQGKWHMGIKGIATAFVLSTLIGDVYGILALFCGESELVLGKTEDIWKSTMETIKTGSSVALNNLCGIFKGIALNSIIFKGLSDEGLIVFAIIGTVNQFSGAVISGIAQTVTPLIGVFYGEMDNLSIKTVIKEALDKGIKGALAMTAFLCLFAGRIGAVLGVRNLTSVNMAVILFSFSILPGLLNQIYIFYYFTTEKIAMANGFTFLKGFAVVVPTAWILSCCKEPRLLWLSFVVAESVTLLVMWGVAKKKRGVNPCLQGMLLLDKRYEEDGKYLAFSVKNTPVEASKAAAKIFDFCKEKGISSKTTMTMSLAVEEMLLIIFEHCLGERSGQYADVRIMMAEEKIILYMRCAGSLFDPIDYYRRKKTEAVRNGRILTDDSLGIEMIIKQAKEVRFRRTFGTNNLTILI